MSEPPIQRCEVEVAYARPDRQFLWKVALAQGATIADALAAARGQAGDEQIPWDSAEVGIFGERQPRSAVLRSGDRVEIYRPLADDPRERRRRRARYAPGSG